MSKTKLLFLFVGIVAGFAVIPLATRADYSCTTTTYSDSSCSADPASSSVCSPDNSSAHGCAPAFGFSFNSSEISCVSCTFGCDPASGQCQPAPAPPACSSDADCDDNSNCSTDTCNNPGTASSACAHGAACGVGQVCNTDIPQPYECVTPACSSDAGCDDSNSCTTDTCNNPGTASAACQHVSNCEAPPPPSDTTAPSVSANHASSSWFTSRTTTLSVSDAGGVNQARYNWDSNPMNAGCTSGGTTFTNEAGLTVSAGSHRLYLCARDNAGLTNTWDSGADQYRVDSTPPASSFRDEVGADTPDGSSWQDANFTVYPSDSDSGGSGVSSCYYGVYSDDGNPSTNDWTIDYGTTRTCGSAFTITVGPTGNCRNTGSQKCQVQIYSTDTAGNTSTTAMRAFSIGFLTYPSGTWQRLWYTTSGTTPNVSWSSFLGETSQSNLAFDDSWSDSLVTFGSNSYSSTVGFQSSRTITISTAGTYRFTLGSDDGMRLYIRDANNSPIQTISAWTDHGYPIPPYSVDVTLAVGSYRLELDYYQMYGAARVSFNYALAPCPKSTDLSLQWDTNVPISGSQCTVTVKHLGFDRTDYSAVSMETQGQSTGYRKVVIDDDPTSGCNNNFSWETHWGSEIPGFNLSVRSTGIAKDTATNKVEYGYEVTSSNCVVQSNTPQCLAGPCSTFASGSPDARTIKTTVTCNDGAPGCQSLAEWAFLNDLNFVECTQNSHCTADPNKAKCNLDSAITYAPQNTCIDSVAPTSKIKRDAGNAIDDDAGIVPGLAPGAPGFYSAFLNGNPNGNPNKRWWVYVQDTDTGGAELDTCYISFNGGPASTRLCDGWASFWVGSQSGANCSSQGDNTCTIKVWAKDRAVNEAATKNLNESTTDERTYPLQDFNEFSFGVDWTPPTAQ